MVPGFPMPKNHFKHVLKILKILREKKSKKAARKLFGQLFCFFFRKFYFSKINYLYTWEHINFEGKLGIMPWPRLEA